MRVLVVEDEALIRMLLCDLLEEAGFECSEAADATQAMAILSDRDERQPDLLVTDYNLGPGLTGADLASAARQRRPGLPVIYVTGNAGCIDSLCTGAPGRVIAKPFADKDLIGAVQDAIGAVPDLLSAVVATAGACRGADTAVLA